MMLHMPAEWRPHLGTHLAWPTNTDTWPGSRLEKIQHLYLTLIATISRHENVYLLVPDAKTSLKIGNQLSELKVSISDVHFHIQPTNDVWIRDYGPLYTINSSNGEKVIVDGNYNAWGGKYPPFGDDRKIAEFYAEKWGLRCLKADIVLEGGAIDVNGSGLLMTSESVLLNSNRNPGYTRLEMEQQLKKYAGAEKIIWFEKGVAGDDTDGHVDDFARFVEVNRAVISLTKQKSDPNYEVLEENYRQLRRAAPELDVVSLPVPDVRTETATADGSNFLPASYTNFYLFNEALLVPVFNDPADRIALELFEELFPERVIYDMYAGDLIWGQGGIHCITQQLPA